MDFDEMNRQVIEEFRAKDGVVEEAAGGFFNDKPILLLHTTGAKSGAERVNPLMFHDEGDRRFIFASKGGAPTNPDWLYNLRANPEVTVEVGADSYGARAAEIAEDERGRVYGVMAERFPQFAEYQEGNPRAIPVVELTPA